jgi:hypothetical protein
MKKRFLITVIALIVAAHHCLKGRIFQEQFHIFVNGDGSRVPWLPLGTSFLRSFSAPWLAPILTGIPTLAFYPTLSPFPGTLQPPIKPATVRGFKPLRDRLIDNLMKFHQVVFIYIYTIDLK